MMPLWRAMVKVILKRPVFWMVLLFIIQVGIDYVSSYMLGRWVTEHLVITCVEISFDMRLKLLGLSIMWIFLFAVYVLNAMKRYANTCGAIVTIRC